MSDPTRHYAPGHDAALDAAWRAHSTELPPPTIDAALRAAAYREVGARPRPASDEDDALAEAREPSRWWWGLAAAATIGAIAFGVLQLAPPPIDPMVASDMPRTEARPEAFGAAPTSPPSSAASGTASMSPVPSAPPGDFGRTQPQRAPSEAPAASAAQPTPAPAPREKPATAPSVTSAEPSAPPPAPSENSAAAPPVTSAAPSTPPARTPPGTVAPRVEQEQPAPQRERAPSAAVTGPAARDAATDAREQATAQSSAPSGVIALERDNAAPRAFPGLAAEPSKPALAHTVPSPRSSIDEAQTRESTNATAATETAKRRAERSIAAGATAAASRAAALPTATEWVERIRAHFDARRFDDAARELNAFRGAYADADAQLPERLRAWAATVTRPR